MWLLIYLEKKQIMENKLVGVQGKDWEGGEAGDDSSRRRKKGKG